MDRYEDRSDAAVTEADEVKKIGGSGGRVGWGLVIGFSLGLILGFLLENMAAGIGFGTGFGLLAGVLADAGSDRQPTPPNTLQPTGQI